MYIKKKVDTNALERIWFTECALKGSAKGKGREGLPV